MAEPVAPATDLRGKAILITGGSMGIGLETARACLRAGASVMICARGVEALETAKKDLSTDATGRNVVTFAVDVGDVDAVHQMFAHFSDELGRCDGVIHAAGIYGPIGSIVDVDPQEWWSALRINLFGTFLITRAAAKQMMQTGGGRIVLFSGGGASGPFPNYSAYASSKVAVVRFAETIAQELAPLIEVNCIAPGFVATRLHEQTLAAGAAAAGAFLEKTQTQLSSGAVPASVGADAAAFLVSDAARGITGRFVAAPYDNYRAWPQRLEALRDSDFFTLRRIIPKNRGEDWQ